MLLALALAAVLETGPMAQSPLPKGWREPTQHEVSQGLKVWRELGAGVFREPGSAPYKDPLFAFEGDFDGDGRVDRAAILLNEKKDKAGLFVMRAAMGRYEALETFDGFDEFLTVHDLEPARPGRHEDACARGLGDNRVPCRRSVTSRWTGIVIGKAEAWAMLYFWDGRKFDTVLLTD